MRRALGSNQDVSRKNRGGKFGVEPAIPLNAHMAATEMASYKEDNIVNYEANEMASYKEEQIADRQQLQWPLVNRKKQHKL